MPRVSARKNGRSRPAPPVKAGGRKATARTAKAPPKANGAARGAAAKAPAKSARGADRRVTEKTVQLCDLGSTNGTLINGKRLIGERDLAHGDKIQIGPLVFEVRLSAGQSETCNCAFDSNETLAPGEEKEAADMSTKPTEHLLKTPPPL